MRSILWDLLHFRVWWFWTFDHEPEVVDHVVGVDRGQHVAEGAVVGAVVVWVPRGVHVHMYNSMNNVCKAQYKAMTEVVQKANTMAGVL